MTHSNKYRLELADPRPHVFVTQIQEREDEEPEVKPSRVKKSVSHIIDTDTREDEQPTKAKQFAVVKESASRILNSGVNTLQHTLLLKMEVEVARTDEELAAKRAEFKLRMEACQQKQQDIQKKQQKLKDRVTKFEVFIKENEIKQRRAIQKYQYEVKAKEQKTIELQEKAAEYTQFKERHAYLKTRCGHYKKFEKFLMKMVEQLPEHYLEPTDTMLNSLMMRHETLSRTNNSCLEHLLHLQDECDSHRKISDDLNEEHSKQVVSLNSDVGRFQRKLEALADHNAAFEQRFLASKIDIRTQHAMFGRIMMAINNLAEMCLDEKDGQLNDLTLTEKLHIIKEFTLERIKVVYRASGGLHHSLSGTRSLERY